MIREQWLADGVLALRPRFESVGHPLPNVVHTSIGFPSRGALSARSRVLGQCWQPESSTDGNCQIFISPVHTTSVEILDTLAHELVHVVTPGAKHKGKFVTVCHSLGLTEGKPTSAAAGPELRAVLERIAADLGPLPHSALNASARLGVKQSTRMVKCECRECGYTARTTRKWLLVGTPGCPACNIPMEASDGIDRLNGERIPA